MLAWGEGIQPGKPAPFDATADVNNSGVGLRLLLGRWGTVAQVGPLEETIGADLSRFLETQESGKEAHPKKC